VILASKQGPGFVWPKEEVIVITNKDTYIPICPVAFLIVVREETRARRSVSIKVI
jgi:hypothetical protein